MKNEFWFLGSGSKGIKSGIIMRIKIRELYVPGVRDVSGSWRYS